MTTTPNDNSGSAEGSAGFGAMFAAAVERTGAGACVGLDPVLERLPDEFASKPAPEAIALFCERVIDAVVPFAAAIKPQSACFERYGSAGFAALERVCAHARDAGTVVVLDAKRGDIGISASHYAASAAGMGAHAVTVNGYLGTSGIEPFLEAGLAVFVLVRTSNPDSDEVQSAKLEGGGSVAEAMASRIALLGGASVDPVSRVSDVGAVVGATKSGDGPALRALMPNQVFLVPGYGAQGGSAQDLAALSAPDLPGGGLLVNSSRGVIYAEPQGGESWQDAVARAAESLRDNLRGIG